MKVRIKAFLLAFSAILIISAAAFGTMAYLTAEDSVNTSFTVGDVRAALVEGSAYLMRPDGTLTEDGALRLVPNYEYFKNITVDIGEGSEHSWVFVKVENGISDIEASDGTPMSCCTERQTYSSIEKQMADYGWLPLMNGETRIRDVYCYREAVSGARLPLFDYFKIDSGVEKGTRAEAEAVSPCEIPADKYFIGDYAKNSIEVTVYAVQAEGLGDPLNAWNTVFADKAA